MSQKAFSFGGLLVIAVAVVLLTVGSGQAAPHGGGGGFHGGGGGFHGGGGGFHGGGFNHGGFNHGGFNHAGFNHGGFHRDGFFGGGFYGGGFYGGGYYPGYGYGDYPSYGYYPSYSYDPSYSYSPYPYGLGYGDTAPSIPDGGTGTLARQSFYAPPAATDTEAHLVVNAPPDADLWFNGSKVTSTGPVREFHSSPLNPGRYSYEIRARWAENGHDVTQTQTVIVTPGEHVKVNFPDPSGIK